MLVIPIFFLTTTLLILQELYRMVVQWITVLLVAWTHITLVRCLTSYSNMKLTTQLQVFLLTHFVYASVKTTIQTAEDTISVHN